MNKLKQQTLDLTVCAVVTALQVIILCVSGLFQTIDLALAAMTVFFTLFIVVELGSRWAWMVYAAVTVLALALAPGTKFTPICYALFFGCYPICKPYLERFGKLPSWMLKLVAFNGVFLIGYAVSARFLLVEDIAPVGSGVFFASFAIANAAFVLFDILMTMALTLYIFKFRKKFGIDRFFRHDGGKDNRK